MKIGKAQAIERPDLFADPRFADREARIANQELLIELLGVDGERALDVTAPPLRGDLDEVLRRGEVSPWHPRP